MFRKATIFSVFAMFSAFFYSASAQISPPATSARSIAATEKTADSLAEALEEKNLTLGAPMFMRIIKAPSYGKGLLNDAIIKVYLQTSDGTYSLFNSYAVCAASGTLGPKTKTGDQQSPEGFYFINGARFNPWSSYHLSLNLGYPNAYDRRQGYSGSYLMIHGRCASIGCYAMTDDGINEIYTLAQAAILNGQRIIRVHSFPFPMSEDNLLAAKASPHYKFWKNLKQGWDWFEIEKTPPSVIVTPGGQYGFETLP